MKMIARAPILSDEADTGNDDTSDLEANGPFVPNFPVDYKKVWTILLASFGLSSRGNTSRNLQTSRTGARRGAPSMIISLGGTR